MPFHLCLLIQIEDKLLVVCQRERDRKREGGGGRERQRRART